MSRDKCCRPFKPAQHPTFAQILIMRNLVTFAALAVLLTASCNSQEETTTSETAETSNNTPAPAPQSSLGEEGTQKLMAVVSDYYSLKDALVATNAQQADEAAVKFMSEVSNMKSYLSADSASGQALMPYLDTLSMGSKQIILVKDETTEQKRIHFEKVSDAMFGMLRAADLKNAGVYRQYCPMAFNDEGAYWLSDVTDIKNPYFGKKMLECGEVTDSL